MADINPSIAMVTEPNPAPEKTRRDLLEVQFRRAKARKHVKILKEALRNEARNSLFEEAGGRRILTRRTFSRDVHAYRERNLARALALARTSLYFVEAEMDAEIEKKERAMNRWVNRIKRAAQRRAAGNEDIGRHAPYRRRGNRRGYTKH